MNAYVFFCASNYFLFTSRTDLLTEDAALAASVTSLQAFALTLPVTPRLTKKIEWVFFFPTSTSPKMTSASEKFIFLACPVSASRSSPAHMVLPGRCFMLIADRPGARCQFHAASLNLFSTQGIYVLLFDVTNFNGRFFFYYFFCFYQLLAINQRHAPTLMLD